MYPKSKSKSKSKRYSKHSKHSKTSKRGGRNAIVSPKIRYSTNVSNDHTNRFKVFTCNTCGFAQLYSNNITCNGKQCDPLVKV